MKKLKHRKHIYRNSTLLVLSLLIIAVCAASCILIQNRIAEKEDELRKMEQEQIKLLKDTISGIKPEKSNIIYPDKLKVPKAKAEVISKSRFRISWKKVPYAEEYVLYRYIPARKKYCPVKKCKGSKAELTRNRGIYSVRAYVNTGEKYIRSDYSKHMTVNAASDTASGYSSVKNLVSLNSSNLIKISTITGFSNATDPQSMCFSGKKYIVSYVNKNGKKGYLVEYSRNGKMITSSAKRNMGFANGSTCNPYKNRIYIVKTHNQIKTSECPTYRLSDLSSESSFNLPKITSGIAYDECNDRYYLSAGAHIYVCDSSFKLIKDIRKKRWYHAQDVGAYNGVAICCSWKAGSESYIDLYRVSDGAYLGGYSVPVGEIESAVVDDGYLVVLINIVGSRNDCIYRTKARIGI